MVECQSFLRGAWADFLAASATGAHLPRDIVKQLDSHATDFKLIARDASASNKTSKLRKPRYAIAKCPICGGNIYARRMLLTWGYYKDVSQKSIEVIGVKTDCDRCYTEYMRPQKIIRYKKDGSIQKITEME